MKKKITLVFLLFFITYTAIGQSITLTPTTDKQLTLTAAGVAVPNITGQRSNGTSDAPTALPNGAWMMSIYGRGYNGSGYSGNYNSAITFGAAQNFTPTANGSNIQFYTTPLNTTSSLERMRIDHDGNVGIGTNAPIFTLDVNSPFNYTARFNGSSGMYISLNENGVYRGYLGSFAGVAEDIDFGTGTSNATGKLHLTTQSVPRLTVAPTGNVGIGTTIPGFPLNFANSVGDKISLWGQSGNHFGLGIDNSLMMIHTDVVGSDIAFGHGTFGAFTETMRMKGNGNLGIGTNSPQAKLHVNGTSILSSTPSLGEQVLIGKTTENDAKVSISNSGYAFGLKIDGTGSTVKALLVNGGASVFGNSTFENDLTVSQTFTADGPAIFNSSATFASGQNVITPNITLNNIDTQFGNATLTGNLAINGSLAVNGSVAKLSGSFKIDHPLEPENKYLYHSFVESPDMMNVYNGNVITDKKGFATVTLPTYFEALNIDFRYQLTAIETFSDVIIFEKIKNNQFKIKSKKPNIEVSWQVTGIRNDTYAKENRLEPEVEKPNTEKGKRLYNSKLDLLQSAKIK